MIQSSSIFPIISFHWVKAWGPYLCLARNHKVNSKYKSGNTDVPKCLVTGLWKCIFTQDYIITLKTTSLLFSIETSIHPANLRPTCQHLTITYPSCHSLFFSSVCIPNTQTRHIPLAKTAGESTLWLGTQSFWWSAFLRGWGRALESWAQGCKHQWGEACGVLNALSFRAHSFFWQ